MHTSCITCDFTPSSAVYVHDVVQLDRLGHARGGDVTGRIRENLYDRKLLQQKLGHLQVCAGQRGCPFWWPLQLGVAAKYSFQAVVASAVYSLLLV